jgi:hypothetical protein
MVIVYLEGHYIFWKSSLFWQLARTHYLNLGSFRFVFFKIWWFFVYLKKRILLHLLAPFFTRLRKFRKKENNYLCMGAIWNRKFYTYPRGSFRVCENLKFGGYVFRLKTLSFNVNGKVSVQHTLCLLVY